jgi:hypothetical protein
LLGNLVSNLPTLRKEDAPDSYGNRPESKTLTEGRYKRPTTVTWTKRPSAAKILKSPKADPASVYW